MGYPKGKLGLIVVTGDPGSRAEEVARLAAQCLPACALITAPRLATLLEQECAGAAIPEKAWPDLITGIVARAALDQHLLLSVAGAEFLFDGFPGLLRVRIAASEQRRIGAVMLERRTDRPAAIAALRDLDHAARVARRQRFGKARAAETRFHLTLSADTLTPEQMAQLLAQAADTTGVFAAGLLSGAAEAQIQFQARLRLAEHGITPPGKAGVKRRAFANRSEEIFANLLDFYRIDWQYEPKSFALVWDEHGQPVEQFTPDFFLPEFNLFVELTTMKQSLVTRKNRKVKLLKQLYPAVNIQVFYQRDFQNLVFKHGLQEKLHEKPVEA